MTKYIKAQDPETGEYRWYDHQDPALRRARAKKRGVRSSLPTPYVQCDGMDAMWNPVNGETYEYKSSYNHAVKAAGCEIIGDDSALKQQKEYTPVPDLDTDMQRFYGDL